MPHIHTEPGQHDPTVSAYIIRLDGDEPRIILHRHRKLGVYMQFGGHIELDETPWQAITHELQEESGYDLKQLTLLQPKERVLKLTNGISHPQPFNYSTHEVGKGSKHYHTDAAYAFIATEEPQGSIDDRESSDIKLFNRAELIASPEIYENVKELILHCFDSILPNWEQVPAITAEIG